MKVISNTSPLINLARIGQLDLLRDLFDGLVVPEAVWRECVIDGEGKPGAAAIRTADWIAIQSVTNLALVQALRQELDAGEAEAIALGLQESADLLLMDERLGRDTARHFNLRCMGLIGVLILAKQHGSIERIKPYLDQLQNEAGFRVAHPLYTQVLFDAGEA